MLPCKSAKRLSSVGFSLSIVTTIRHHVSLSPSLFNIAPVEYAASRTASVRRRRALEHLKTQANCLARFFVAVGAERSSASSPSFASPSHVPETALETEPARDRAGVCSARRSPFRSE